MKNKFIATLFIISIIVFLSGCNQTSETDEKIPATSDAPAKFSETVVNSATPSESPKTLTTFDRLFQNGPIAAQNEDELWGYIDISGNYVIEPIYKDVTAFGINGLAVVQDTNSEYWGIINTNGEYVVDPKFSVAGTEFHDGLLRVCEKNIGWGYIDESGQYMIEPRFISAYDFSDGFARVCTRLERKEQNSFYIWGYVNTSGKLIADGFYEAFDFSQERAVVKTYDYFYGMYGYIDTSGEYVVTPQLETATSFSGGIAFGWALAAGPYDDRTVLFDLDGNWLVESTLYEPITNSGYRAGWGEDLSPVRLCDRSGYVYINKQGDIVLPKAGETYGYARSFSNGYALVTDRQTNLTGVIDVDGNWVIAPEYTSVDYISSDGLVQVGTTQSVRLMDIHGDCVTEFDLTNEVKPLGSLRRELILVGSYAGDGSIAKAGFWDQSGNVVIDCIFEQASDFSYDMGYAKVKSDGKWGMIDRDGNWLIPANYLEIRV